MSRYAPGYTGPMTTAGGVKRPTTSGIKPVTPVTKPGKPNPKKGMAMGGMTKKGYNKGGMANCGASMKPAQGK
jgi:hypothetical protein